MANRTRFAGEFNALNYAYGITGSGSPAPLEVDIGTTATGAGTLTLVTGQVVLSDGTVLFPVSTLAPITVDAGSNAETVTPTAVSNPAVLGYDNTTITATFANTHGRGVLISSGSIGLQEAINDAQARGGGVVVVDSAWRAAGGTNAILAAATLPSTGTVTIVDRSSGAPVYWANKPTGAAIAAPAAATTATVASQAGVTGTWTATTIHVVFTYVTALGGETLASSDYSFTSTVSVAIGGSGPAAATGAVGYRVYLGTTAWQAPVTAANGTVIQCGPIAAFKIGTPFSVATATTSALALVPGASTAFGTIKPQPSYQPPQVFQTAYNAFADAGTIAAAATGSLAEVNLPAGFLNFVGRTIRLKGKGFSTNSANTGTITVALKLHSVYGTTSITPFTAVSGTLTSAAVISFDFDITMTCAAAGATGTVECHGFIGYTLACTAPLTMAADIIVAVSSTVDLTAQNTLEFTLAPVTGSPTANQIRQLTVEVLQ